MNSATLDTRRVANPVTALHDLLADQVTALNAMIHDRMRSDVALINTLGAYIIAAGGKRLRPMLTLAMAQLFGKDDPVLQEKIVKLAAAVEFIHTATLLHDDVVDESDQRRGQPSANAMFGNQASVLVGDFLFSRAFELMVETDSLDVLRILSHASAVIASGEVLQLTSVGDLGIDQARYLQIVGAKTAALFAAACEAGALVVGADPEQIEAARRFGEGLGVAFQIADDVMDYQSDAATMGKNPGDDFREGKVTLPVILALQDATADERKFWQDSLGDCAETCRRQDADLAQAIDILHSHDALNKALAVAQSEAAAAASCLEALPAHPVRDLLQQIPAFAVTRLA